MNYIALAVSDMGVAENMKKYASNVTLSGLIIVFAMLVALVAIISIFGFVMYRLTNKDKPKAPKVSKPKAEKIVQQVVNVTDDSDDVIAAISAAVMMMYEGTGVTPVIRSVRQVNKGVRSAWATAGIVNNTRSF